MNTNQISASRQNQTEECLWQELTEPEQEKLSGGFRTSASWALGQITSLQNYNWHYGGGQQRFINNVRQNGLGVIDRRVNAILGNLRRFW
jgi:hypothetical protein